MSKVKVPEPKSDKTGRKNNPHLPIPKFDLTKLNLLPVPKDGEWCCNWVNEIPIGAEGYLDGPDGHKRPTVLVEDWRLPAGWTKHLYQRSSVSGKWDVVLVSLKLENLFPDHEFDRKKIRLAGWTDQETFPIEKRCEIVFGREGRSLQSGHL